MSNHEFAKGKQVVCIDTNWLSGGDPLKNYPVLNGVYTIREIYDWSDSLISFVFEEISNPHNLNYDREHSFVSFHFRPVRDTDISEFTAYLNDVPKKQEAPVRKLETVR